MNTSAHAVMEHNFNFGVAGEFDYTFTDKELDDVLGFMERQQGRGPGEPYPTPPPALAPLLGPSAHAGAPLQFQPHVGYGFDVGHGASAGASHGYEYGMMGYASPYGDSGRVSPYIPLESKLEILESPRSGQGGAMGSGAGDSLYGQHVSSPAPPYPRHGTPAGSGNRGPVAHGTVPAGREPRTSSGSAGAGPSGPTPPPAVGPRRDGKPHISHSTVEKQRRDRINSLIDELRDLVPPQMTPGAEVPGETAAMIDQRRPKHVVLADTIQLVRGLQEKLMLSETRHETPSGRPGAGSSSSANGGASADNAGAVGAAEAEIQRDQLSANSHRSTDSHPELPQAPDDSALMEEGIIVEDAGNDELHIKVHCKDRAGLLSDIVRALKQSPLEISSAAVTTTRHGMVCDVFQVRPERGEQLDADVLRAAVDAVVFGPPGAGEKKRRGGPIE